MYLRIHFYRIAFFSACVFALPTGASWAFDDPLPAIRIVRVGHGNVVGLKRNIETSDAACKLVNNLPLTAASLPPDSLIAKLVVMEEEELFDGQMWALYKTNRYIGADSRKGCQLVTFIHRSATIGRTCEREMYGRSADLSDLMDPETRVVPSPKIFDRDKTSQSCNAKRISMNLENIPTERVIGIQCHWGADVTNQQLGTNISAKESGSFDTCSYHKMPLYFYKGNGRPIILKTRGSTKSLMGGANTAEIFGGIQAAFNAVATEFSEGKPIPHSRFSRQSVNDFINLPNSIPIEGK